ncbi:protein IQ-DOMAIN 32 [Lactuca sativa]|uniref:DUF4005 domain-containing protein n=1 Tax=Lactuca sativa TaxID=4236 RepID=A0A9R1UT26_LACSA|nr:protein IQ-DOMAIN 32 [Lactuca sativa]KAJ0192413.1 hypothetical protein LSAT_V11C800401460 [Lactuca sativa]
MGRSTTSCFKIISCGGGSNESVDRDDIDASSENKDKRGWSFRKRSARHRVLSNTVITETPLENKPISEPVPLTSEPQLNSSISEKTCDSIWTEESPQLSNPITKDAVTMSTMATDTCEDDIKSEPVVDESAILVIQSAVRRFLAQRELVRYKNVVKLQAAVRGHLVRNHAVGTLRCVQAIVKMQALVRARRADVASEINSDPKYISIEKLLSNSLARQLLESAPKNKQINIKCVPSKSDSAWNWLERWMSVSSPETVESRTPEQNQDQDQEKVINNTENQVETVIPDCESRELESNVGEETVFSDEKVNLVKVNTEEKSNEEEIPQPESMDLIVEESVLEIEPKRVTKRLATDEADSEGRKSVFGSRKPINPSFIAAQSRFEELTSKNNIPSKPSDYSSKQENDDFTPEHITPSKPINTSSNQDNDVGTPEDDTSKPINNSSNQENDDFTPEDIIPSKPINNVISSVTPEESLVSECGTELSITSTLDSPDPSEVETKKLPEDSKVSNQEIDDTNGDNIEEHNNVVENIEKLPEDSKVPEDTPSEADIEINLEPNSNSDSVHQIPESLSPRSHITAPESQGTPNSQLSTNTKKSSTKNVSSQKRKSWSTSKKSTVDSGSKLESLPKETKPGKRRNSFGSPKPDNSDHEGNGLLPSYMQATESARAKAIANGSPRSSPDVQDKEIYLKKRHSLPGNGRQASPRIQRSVSQALESAKGNGNQEKKWQR